MFQAFYKAAVMLVIPLICIIGEVRRNRSKDKKFGIGTACSKWFVFWTIGFSAVTTGFMQIFIPSYTAGLLGTEMNETMIISELGFANAAMGIFALISLWKKELRRPAALNYGMYILGCTLLHAARLDKMNLGEWSSLIGDIWIIIVVIVVAVIQPWKKKEKSKPLSSGN